MNATHRVQAKTKKKSCVTFCKKDYRNKLSRRFAKLKLPQSKDWNFSMKVCKKTFCNPKCAGYDTTRPFYKKIKNGFQPQYDADLFRESGALSGCVFMPDIV
jgi:hypothetical protein